MLLNVNSFGSLIAIVNDLVVALKPNWSSARTVNVYVLSIEVVPESRILSLLSNVVSPDTANASYTSHLAVSVTKSAADV